jgi:uncharacterized membrane protein YqiK
MSFALPSAIIGAVVVVVIVVIVLAIYSSGRR